MIKTLMVSMVVMILLIGSLSCQNKVDIRVGNIPIQKEVTGMGGYEKAIFGGGCFWCLEALFQRLKGVSSVISGYAGGSEINPTYQRVCAGFTGHAEVIQIEFDPKIIAFEKLLELFWDMHDPTLLNRQGNDYGTQYRSIILYTTPQQKQTAEDLREKLSGSMVYKNPIVTEIKPLDVFYPAETYHQNYYIENKYQPYCSIVIAPKVKKFVEKYKELLTN